MEQQPEPRQRLQSLYRNPYGTATFLKPQKATEGLALLPIFSWQGKVKRAESCIQANVFPSFGLRSVQSVCFLKVFVHSTVMLCYLFFSIAMNEVGTISHRRVANIRFQLHTESTELQKFDINALSGPNAYQGNFRTFLDFHQK